MNENSIKEFVGEYTKGVDLINCVHYAIDNDFNKPDDYDDYGCSIEFLEPEQVSVKTEEEVSEWYVHHQNSFTTKEIDADSPMGFSFPPPYNFIDVDEVEITESDDEEATALVRTSNMNYEFTVVPASDRELGLAITAITGNLPFGGSPIEIL